jgi:hypothetical protein
MDIGRNADKIAFDDKQLALKVQNFLLKVCALANRDERALSRPENTASADPPLPFLYHG